MSFTHFLEMLKSACHIVFQLSINLLLIPHKTLDVLQEKAIELERGTKIKKLAQNSTT